MEPVYEFHFARYYDDHMVLQRAPGRAVIWGYGPVINDNTSVMVTIDNNSTRRVTYYTTVKYTGLKRLTAFLLVVLTQSVSSMFGTVCRVIQLTRLVRILHCLYLARSLLLLLHVLNFEFVFISFTNCPLLFTIVLLSFLCI